MKRARSLSDAQVARQAAWILGNRLVPTIEFTTEPAPRNIYWSLWRLPLFDAETVEEVTAEIGACAQANPAAFVKLTGYDPRRQGTAASLVVRRPAWR